METSKRELLRNIGFGVVVCLITIAAFSSALTSELVHWDDDINILHNPHIHKINGQSLTWMFTDSSYTPRYRPLNWLSWAALYHFFGPNPFPYHALTLLLHGLNATLLFFVIQKGMQLSRGNALSTSQKVLCAFATLLWALHPLRVEAVAWVNCQIYTQSLLFLLISLLFYFRATTHETPMQSLAYWTSFAFFLFSLLTYPTAVAFVVVLLAIDFFPLKRLDLSKLFSTANRSVFVEKIPFAVLTVFVAGIALWARANATAMWSEASDAARLNSIDQAAQAFYIWAYYLWKPFVVLNLSPVYTQLVEFRWSEWQFVASATLVLGISATLIALRRKLPVLLAIWVCYLALLVPMLGLTEHPHYPNDRYSYIVSILFSVLIAAGLLHLSIHRFRMAATAIGTIVLVGLTTLTVRQTRVWHDSYTLFDHALLKLGSDPYRADIFCRLARVHAGQGRFDSAVEAYSKALAIQPAFNKAHIDLATVYIQKGQTNEAVIHYREALSRKPNDPLANYNLGAVLENLGDASQALACFRNAVTNDPNNLDYRLGFASALSRSGKQPEAFEELQEALTRHPKSPEALCRVGGALAAQQRLPEAIEHFSNALNLNPAHGEAHYNLGTALAMSGKIADATSHFLESARLAPKSQTHLACGMALSETGRMSEAAESYRRALKIQPDMMPALVNLCWLLSANPDPKVRNGKEAISLAQQALKYDGEKHPEAYDLLAAAYAEAGRFQEAVEAAQHASTLANTAGRPDLSADLERKRKMYEAGQPFRM